VRKNTKIRKDVVGKTKKISGLDWSGLFGEVIGLLICLWSLDNIHKWGLPFVIPKEYVLWLPIAKYTSIVSSIFKMLAILMRSTKIKNLMLALSSTAVCVSMYYLVRIFPLDFSFINPAMNWMMRVVLSLSFFGVVMGVLVRFVKAV